MQKVIRLFLALILVGFTAAYLYAVYEEVQPTREPEWVKEIKEMINPALCGPTDCEACDADRCAEFGDACKVESKMYSCGADCDAGIAYCVPAK